METSQFYDSEEVHELMRAVRTGRLASELHAEPREFAFAAPLLRVSANLAQAEFFSGRSIDDISDDGEAMNGSGHKDNSETLFPRWESLLNSALEADETLQLADLVSFAAAGFIENRTSEVRAFLKRKPVAEALRNVMDGDDSEDWQYLVQKYVNGSLILTIIQSSYQDLSQAQNMILRLTELQKKLEPEWLEQSASGLAQAAFMVGMYHVAEAVKRLSVFIQTGSTNDGLESLSDPRLMLRRLFNKAFDFIDTSGEPVLGVWVREAYILCLLLRSQSIWIRRGISDRSDQLLLSLAEEGRSQPLFSLLPSQQQALNSYLLDPARVAVVLQMPTSAGKTLLAEFAIVQAFGAYHRDTRVVYVVPTRALVSQTRRTLASDLGALDIDVIAASSAFDDDPFEQNVLQNREGVVVATPEKFDLIIRSKPNWLKNLRLVVIDEAHLLNEKSERAARLEMLLATLRREHSDVRILLLTPFIQNAEQIANWLGGTRSLPVQVNWRPSSILIGKTSYKKHKGQRACTTSISFSDPFFPGRDPDTITIESKDEDSDLATGNNLKKVVFLSRQAESSGTTLALFSASKQYAEDCAGLMSEQSPLLSYDQLTPELRLAVAIAEDEGGEKSTLAKCLRRGVAYHHSSVSNTLRYLIEDQVKAGTLRFIAATTTLAQGMNFPVANVIIHSVNKPYGQGNLTPSEFWNIAGRSGRVGLSDKGKVIFANPDHANLADYYSRELSSEIRSALLGVLDSVLSNMNLKDAYKKIDQIRPLIQYLAHISVSIGSKNAIERLEEIVEGSLASRQWEAKDEKVAFFRFALRYLQGLVGQPVRKLALADAAGLGSFSFDELYAKTASNPILAAGPTEVLRRGEEGIFHLVDAIRWLPEFKLGIGDGAGQMNVKKVAQVVYGWMNGVSVHDLSQYFPGRNSEQKLRSACNYLNGEVSSLISWGAFAYMRSWMLKAGTTEIETEGQMLGSYIQHGVKTPEGALASLAGVPRQFAECFGAEYRSNNQAVVPDQANAFIHYIRQGDKDLWSRVVGRSAIGSKINAEDARLVWLRSQGLE